MNEKHYGTLEGLPREYILVSNPENDFNKTKLGIHTIGLVPIKYIDELNKLGYGLTSWNGLQVYFS